MAKRRRASKRRFNLRKVRINNIVAATALASADVTSGSISDAAVDPYRLMSVDASYSWVDIQAAIDDGFTFGLAHSDYSAAEIEECLEAQGAIDIGDKVAQEQSNRLVREIGVIRSTPGGAVTGSAIFNNGIPEKTKLNWLMSTGDTLNVWIRNQSQTIWTVGSNLAINGKFWIKDSV